MPAPGNPTLHIFPLAWLLIACTALFGLAVAFDQGYFARMFAADSSRLTVLIVLGFLVASGHAAWHIFQTSWRLQAASRALAGKALERLDGADPALRVVATPAEYVDGFIAEVIGSQSKAKRNETGQNTIVLEIYADRARSATEIGWYIVDILIRLGLIGTIVGFILILGTLSDGPEPTADNIQSLLISMSGGMGVALYTTLAGLVAATLAGFQYLVLGRCVERLISVLIMLNEAVQSRAEES